MKEIFLVFYRTTGIYANTKRKQIIYVEGNCPARLYYIKKGKVKTYKTNEEGKELIVGIYGEGDFLGYVALLEGTVYKERAETMENTELAIIPKDEFDSLMNTRARSGEPIYDHAWQGTLPKRNSCCWDWPITPCAKKWPMPLLL